MSLPNFQRKNKPKKSFPNFQRRFWISNGVSEFPVSQFPTPRYDESNGDGLDPELESRKSKFSDRGTLKSHFWNYNFSWSNFMNHKPVFFSGTYSVMSLGSRCAASLILQPFCFFLL